MNALDVSTAGDDPAVVLERRIAAARGEVEVGNLPSGTRMLRAVLVMVEASPALADQRGRVLHHLCAAAGLAGADRACHDYYTRAARLYGPDHRCLPHLAHDSVLPALLRGEFSPVIERLEPVREHVVVPCAAVTLWANLALAYASSGRLLEARALTPSVEQLADSLGNAWAYGCLARIAYAAGDSLQTWRTKAHHARRVASVVRDPFTARAMRDLLA